LPLFQRLLFGALLTFCSFFFADLQRIAVLLNRTTEFSLTYSFQQHLQQVWSSPPSNGVWWEEPIWEFGRLSKLVEGLCLFNIGAQLGKILEQNFIQVITTIVSENGAKQNSHFQQFLQKVEKPPHLSTKIKKKKKTLSHSQR
jgi:hypothetical protein